MLNEKQIKMPSAIIKLTWMRVMEHGTQDDFERNVLDLSYAEFLTHLQAYEIGERKTWAAIVQQFPKARLGLSYKAGLAFGQMMAPFGKTVPGLMDSLGLEEIPYDYYDFRILDADIRDKKAYKAALLYRTGPLTLFDTMGEHLLVALGDTTQLAPDAFFETFFIKMQPKLSIWSYQAL